jgi:hypothetical protein
MVLWKQANELYNIKAFHIKQIRFNTTPINLEKEKEKQLNAPIPSNPQSHHQACNSSS